MSIKSKALFVTGASLAVAVTIVLAGCTGAPGSTTTTGQPSAAANGAGANAVSKASGALERPLGPFPVHKDGKLNIGWVELTADCQSCVQALAEFKKYIQANKFDWKLETLNSKGDPAGVASAIEDFTSRKVDVIVTAFTVMKAGGAAIKAANAANIPIFSLDSGWTKGVVGDVTTDNFSMGGEIASYMADRFGGKLNVVAIYSDQHYGVLIRDEMLQNLTKSRYPGLNILDNKNVTLAGSYQEGTKAAEDWASRFGTKIDALYCGFDDPCEAAAAAFKKAGLCIPAFGIDGHVEAMKEIRANNNKCGLVATMAQQFGPFATTVASWINEILVNGKSVSDVVPIPEVYLPSKLITSLNVPPVGVEPWTVPDYYTITGNVPVANR